MNSSVAVVGGSGFVGSAVVAALRARDVDVRVVRAPRLPERGIRPNASAPVAVHAYADAVHELATELSGVSAVVNCAGDPDASSQDTDKLDRANGYLVAVVAAASTNAQAERFVHVSSAVVQGRRPVLDESLEYDPFSAYARSKILGERMALETRPEGTTIYRPPSVHSPGRRVTQLTTRIAQSRLSTVCAPGDQPTPQALLDNVGDAVAFLATSSDAPPPVVIHPWEGLTVTTLLETLGGRRPVRLPSLVAKAIAGSLSQVGVRVPRVAANARRVEMIWFGQGQAESWLTTHQWRPPVSWGGMRPTPDRN